MHFLTRKLPGGFQLKKGKSTKKEEETEECRPPFPLLCMISTEVTRHSLKTRRESESTLWPGSKACLVYNQPLALEGLCSLLSFPVEIVVALFPVDDFPDRDAAPILESECVTDSTRLTTLFSFSNAPLVAR